MSRQDRKSKCKKIQIYRPNSTENLPSTSNNYQFGRSEPTLEPDPNPRKLDIVVRNASNRYFRASRKSKHEYYAVIFENYVAAPNIAYKSVAHLLGRKKQGTTVVS